MGLNLDEQKAVDRFRQQVVEPSRNKLVILDFWAEWCGPCKALSPTLEKVAADYADKGVELVKLNVDEEQFIAAQFQVRSIPTVLRDLPGPAGRRPDRRAHRIAAEAAARPAAREAAADGRAADQQADVAQLVAMGEAGPRRRRWRAGGLDLRADRRDGARCCRGSFRSWSAPARRGPDRAGAGPFDALPEALRADPLVAQAGSALALAGERGRRGRTAGAARRRRRAARPTRRPSSRSPRRRSPRASATTRPRPCSG
jgi:putative thioredoxin